MVLDEIGFDKDHIHFVMIIPPKYSISDVVGKLKSQSASMMRERYNWLSKWKDIIIKNLKYFKKMALMIEKV